MNFWNKLTRELVANGLSIEKIARLQLQFGNLNAVELAALQGSALEPFIGSVQGGIKIFRDAVRKTQESISTPAGATPPIRPIQPQQTTPIKIIFIEEDNAKKLANFNTEVSQINEQGEPELIAQNRTDSNGELTVSATFSGQTVPEKIQLVIRLIGRNGKDLYSDRSTHLTEDAKPIVIMVDVKEYNLSLRVPLNNLPAPALQPLQQQFNNLNIETLADLRELEDHSVFNLPSEAARNSFQTILAHANLQVLSDDIPTNQLLIDRDFQSLTNIAATPKVEFERRLRDSGLEQKNVRQLHRLARKQMAVLKAIETEHRINRANGYQAESPLLSELDPPEGFINCHCDECRSAVSPAAYLADLMDFAIDHIEFEHRTLTPEHLTEHFKQPFLNLIYDCTSLNETVRTVRLVIEVLRVLVEEDDALKGDLNKIIKKHNQSVYSNILQQLRLSYSQLRSARLDEQEKNRIISRLNIAFNRNENGDLDEDLNKLINLIRLNKQEITEASLTQIFGFQSTSTTDITQTGLIEQRSPIITMWHAQGEEWSRNTDGEGIIYGQLEKQATHYTCQLFSTEQRSDDDLVASGTLNIDAGKNALTLFPRNDSGLLVSLQIDTNLNLPNNVMLFSVHAVPQFKAKKLQLLNARWLREDKQENLQQPAVIIDPDNLVAQDFMQPIAKNIAFEVFDYRKQWLTDREEQFQQHASLNETFSSLNTAFTYQKHGSNDSIESMLWDDSFKPLEGSDNSEKTNLEILADNLRSEDEETQRQATEELNNNVHLSINELFLFESFYKKTNEITPAGDGQQPDEATQERLAEIRAAASFIAIKALKKRFYTHWNIEEQELEIHLSAPFFCDANYSAELNARGDQSERNEWLTALQSNSEPPIIDPDRMTISWIESSEIAEAYRLRRAQLGVIEAALKAQITNYQSFLSVLSDTPVEASDDNNRVTVCHELGFTEGELSAQLELLREGEPLNINPANYGLTAAAFIQILNTYELLINDEAEVDDGDWEHVHNILIQVEKKRYLLPEWKQEERLASTYISPSHFNFPESLTHRLNPNPSSSDSFREWRIDNRAWRNFKERLQSRIEEKNATNADYDALIDRVEEATLTSLRDDLLRISMDGDSVTDKAKHFTNQYLMNAMAAPCHKTTRISQAMESLQLLVWGVYTDQFEDDNFSIALPADNDDEFRTQFEGEWKWMGSYASWRTAMFVFLYPENLLQPSFYSEKHQSRAYKAFLKLLSTWPEFLKSQDSDSDSSLDAEDFDLRQVNIIARNIHRFSFGYGDFTPKYLEKDYLSRKWLISLIEGVRRYQVTAVFHDSVLSDLENYFYIFFSIAKFLQKLGHFDESLYWYNNILDMSRYEFSDDFARLNFSEVGGLTRHDDWLIEPLDLHNLALTRRPVFGRSLIISLTSCLLEYSESEFAKDTTESIAKSRELYLTAEELLSLDILEGDTTSCAEIISGLEVQIGSDIINVVSRSINDMISQVNRSNINNQLAWRGFREYIENQVNFYRAASVNEIRNDISNFIDENFPIVDISTLQINQMQSSDIDSMLNQPAFFELTQNTSNQISFLEDLGIELGQPERETPTLPEPAPYLAPRVNFCVPKNPFVDMLKLRVEAGLFKINNCMNIAGVVRELPAFSAPTDTQSGIPLVNSSGRPVITGFSSTPPPTQYRYKVLIERARQLISVAQQMEASHLNFLERIDQENYSLMQAENHLDVSRATVRLQDTRIREAVLQVEIADLNLGKVNTVHSHYSSLIENDLNAYEIASITTLGISAGISNIVLLGRLAASLSGFPPTGDELETVYRALSSIEAFSSRMGSFERRKEEWKFQQSIAEEDINIATKQKAAVEQAKRIVLQEKNIASSNSAHAREALNFLSNKFTSVELYDWMSGIIGESYRYFLQQATAMAKLAQTQLAFERQEQGLSFIQSDYWTVAGSGLLSSLSGDTQDRRGLTGSARLLQDLTTLDQHAFLTDQRKLQMRKTLSLNLQDPIVFQAFRESGNLIFTTTLEQFDRDFPGHYLRLIKKVRCTVLALVPPQEGIKATLSMDSSSRAITKREQNFEEVTIQRLEKQEVALTSPANATGVFELNEQPEMLFPFEGSGVAANWTFSMPKAANPIDYNTIADVLITIDYTALNDDRYQQEVIERLEQDTSVSAMRPYSFRQQLVDTWYLLNSAPEGEDIESSFVVLREDFPPNLDDIQIRALDLIFVFKAERPDNSAVSLSLTSEEFAGPIGSNAQLQDSGNSENSQASFRSFSQKSPFGTWSIRLNQDDDLVSLLRDEQVEDIVLVIEYTANSKPWNIN